MNKTKIKILLLGLLLSVLPIGYSAYKILDYTIGQFDGASNSLSEVNSQFVSVVFKANESLGLTESKLYKEVGSSLTLEDFPMLYNGNNILVWTEEKDQELKISLNGNDRVDNITRNLIFTASIDTAQNDPVTSFNDNNFIKNDEAHKNNNKNISFNGNTFNFREGNQNTDKSLINNSETIDDVVILENCTVNMSFYKDSEILNVSFDNNSNRSLRVNGDTTIGLEDKNSNLSDYKPNAGPNSANINYCASRLTLSNDLILKNTTLNIGGRIGFYGSIETYPQTNFQGFIIGQYNEIDLNGNYLILEQGSKIWSLGSITNTKPKSGGIIVKSGAQIITPLVVEDQHHERHMPVDYMNGDAIFSMYRTPYFNVNAKFEYGSQLFGGANISFGNSSGSVYMEWQLIGPENYTLTSSSQTAPLIMMKNKSDSYIYLETKYDSEIKNYFNGNKFCIENILYQKTIVNLVNSSVTIYPPSFEPTLDLTLMKVTFSFDFKKNNFYIPPYFDIYSFSTELIFDSKLIFMPGSYLYCDKDSSLTFQSANGISSIEPEPSNQAFRLNGFYKQSYFHVAQLLFMDRYDLYNDTINWIDNGDNLGTRRDGCDYIWLDGQLFWNYLNLYKKAKCDFYGKISFDNLNTSYGVYYELGGNFNIYNLSNFSNAVRGRNDVKLYSVSNRNAPCMFDWDRGYEFPLMTIEISERINVQSYYTLPLISFGYVISDPTNPFELINDYKKTAATYDESTGLITYNGSNYGFIFQKDKTQGVNYSVDHLNKTHYQSESDYVKGFDDLTGKYYEFDSTAFNGIYILTDSAASSGLLNKSFAYFHGMFVEAIATAQNKATLNLSKFRNSYCNYNSTNGYMSSVSCSYSNLSYYGYNAWSIA